MLRTSAGVNSHELSRYWMFFEDAGFLHISSIHHGFQYVSHVRGVGASSIAAAFNGAYVTLVDAFVTDELLDNLEASA